jgi:mono/diheme cytochrome c family protein
MNYPIWELPGSGLLIAAVAILHVFVSHFAVGGGLFLVVTEWKARRENDEELLGWLRRHSRFFVLLTLVFGAVTGVGIWFTIALVHPAATSSLINAFVWGWAIEWAFFFTEIAAAIVYFYGWDRLTPKQHLTVGWIYFGAAWASMIVINGILAYMLTPGDWLSSRSFVDGFFNPTYWSSLTIRTLGAMGLAGVYALFTASWLASPALKQKLGRWAATAWVLPMAIGLPIALLWYFSAADYADVPVAEIFGAPTAGPLDLLGSIFTALPASGHPVAQRALRVAFGSITVTILATFALVLFRRQRYGRVATAIVMFAALFSIGGSEWAREGLRKPYVIGSYMFVNGVRLPPPEGSLASKAKMDDALSIDRLQQAGILATARFVRPVSDSTTWTPGQEIAAGHDVFRLLCSQCHTTDGYLAIRPLVRGRNSTAIEGMITRLAQPRDAAGHATAWSRPHVQLATWRNRRMAPFVGTPAEQRALAVYLASLGGGKIEPRAQPISGAAVFESSCAACHTSDGDWPIAPRVAGRNELQIYDALGRLPELNEMMPPFEGTDEERRALAGYLAALPAQGR